MSKQYFKKIYSGLRKEYEPLKDYIEKAKRLESDIAETIKMYKKELKRENPLVYTACAYYQQPGRSEIVSIWRTQDEADKVMDGLFTGDYDIQADREMATSLRLADIKEPQLIQDMAIRELQ